MGGDRRRRVADVDQPSMLVVARAVNVLGALLPLASSNASPVGSRQMAASYPSDPVRRGLRLASRARPSPHLGMENRGTTILGTNDDPVATYQQYAHDLGRTVLRSEFEPHFLAPDRPTFAQLDAYPHKSPKSLWRTRSEPVGRLPGSDRPDAVLSPTPGAARMASVDPGRQRSGSRFRRGSAATPAPVARGGLLRGPHLGDGRGRHRGDRGRERQARPADDRGELDVSSGAACLGAKAFVVSQASSSAVDTQGTLRGELTFKHGQLTGAAD